MKDKITNENSSKLEGEWHKGEKCPRGCGSYIWHIDVDCPFVSSKDTHKRLTQTQFIKEYCDRSKITEQELNDLGRFAIPCDCEDESCNGWAMIGRGSIHSHVELYINEKI